MRPTILIVDDEAPIRRVLARELSGSYTVLQAAGASEALRELAARDDICLVLADDGLGDGRGTDLLREIGQRTPPPARVLMSGDLPEVDGLDGTLAKPWEPGAVLAMIRSALDMAIRV